MAQTLTARATSLAASTALLALAAVAAFSMKWAISHVPDAADPTPIESVREQLLIPPQPSHPVQHVRPPDPTQTTVETTQPAQTTQISTTAPAGAAAPDPSPPTISNPHWLQTPRDLARYYPLAAIRRDIEGEVQLDCLVTVTGALQCSVASETPANWGFGAAAIRIAQDYRMVPATRDGAPVEARYRMRVPFRLGR
jgi:protein TonB